MGLDGRVAGDAVRVSTMGGLRGDALGKRRPRTGGAVPQSPALCAHGLSRLRVQAAGVRRFGAPQCDERVRTRAGALLGSSWLGSARRARAWSRRGGAARAGTAAALSWRVREPGAGRWRAARGAGRCAPSSCRAGVCGEEDRAGSGVLRGRSGVQGWRVRVEGVAGWSRGRRGRVKRAAEKKGRREREKRKREKRKRKWRKRKEEEKIEKGKRKVKMEEKKREEGE